MFLSRGDRDLGIAFQSLGPWQREQREWSSFLGSRRAAFSDLKACPKEKEWLVCPTSYVLRGLIGWVAQKADFNIS